MAVADDRLMPDGARGGRRIMGNLRPSKGRTSAVVVMGTLTPERPPLTVKAPTAAADREGGKLAATTWYGSRFPGALPDQLPDLDRAAGTRWRISTLDTCRRRARRIQHGGWSEGQAWGREQCRALDALPARWSSPRAITTAGQIQDTPASIHPKKSLQPGTGSS